MLKIKRTALFLFCFFMTLCTSGFSQEPPPMAELLKKIEARRGTWTGFTADVILNFQNADGGKASCSGHLAYHRLDEKILLSCFNDKQQPLFYFRTDDTAFQLYLAGRNTVYQGSIFDLESSPDVQSHLKALDLYRALKPQLLEQDGLESETGEKNIHLKVIKAGALFRELDVSPEGDVREEIYYNSKVKPLVHIQRSDFQEIQGVQPRSVYPDRIRIASAKNPDKNEEYNETNIVFEKVRFFSALDAVEFEIPLPENVRRLNL